MRVWILAALSALLLWAQPASAQQLLTPREFGDAAIAVIQHTAPQAEIERRDDLRVVIRGAALPEGTMNFDNAYNEYQRHPAQLTEIIDRWARLATQTPEHAQMRERVVSVLRHRDMVDQFAAEAAAVRRENDLPPSTLVWRPFAGDLVEVIVFDGAETIQYALVETLAEIDISPDLAWSIAPGNLPARLGELEISGVEGSDYLVYVTGGNGLAPSTIADRGFCATEGGPSFIFLIVDRNGYVMADRTKPQALTEFRELYGQIMSGDGAMSQTPIACEGGEMRAVTFTD